MMIEFNDDFYEFFTEKDKWKKIIELHYEANEKLFITFKFDWETYVSWVVITASDTKKEVLLRTPQIPTIGGVWSNHVASRMAVGQMMVSSMLEAARVNLNTIYISDTSNIEVIKVDRCFYAPLLYHLRDEGLPSFKEEKIYFPMLKENYPEAFVNILALSDTRLFWAKYHDKPVVVVKTSINLN